MSDPDKDQPSRDPSQPIIDDGLSTAKWPYPAEDNFESVDPGAIEKQAEVMLSRALNIGRLTAFVGAGVSLAYGRFSWSELTELQIERVIREYEDLAEHQKRPHIKRLYETLDVLRAKPGESDSIRNPLMFQVCEALENAVRQVALKSKEPIDLRLWAEGEVRNDLGHAKALLRGAIVDLISNKIREIVEKIDKTEADKKTTESYRETLSKIDKKIDELCADDLTYVFSDSELFRRTIRRTKFLNRASEKRIARSVLDQISSISAGRLGWTAKSRTNTPLLPTDRYLFEVVLKLAPTFDDENSLAADVEKFLKNALPRPPNRMEVARDPRVRSEIVPLYRDPLLLLHRRLGISGYITTNYDHELDRLFGEKGLGHREVRGADDSFGPGQDNRPSDLMKPSYQVTVFGKDRTGELLTFAARERSRSARIVHLHGRSRIDDSDAKGGDTIYTERDYQNRYTALNDQRDLVDHSIRAAFGSGPILFYGSNGKEDDLMRPLRQFVGTPNRGEDRLAVALLPALSSNKGRLEEKINLLSAFGVYAVHYGKAIVDNDYPDDAVLDHKDSVNGRGERARRDERSSYWLPWYNQSIHTPILDVLARITEIKNPGTRVALEALRTHCAAFAEDILKALAADRERARDRRLSPFIHKPSGSADAVLVLKQLSHLEGVDCNDSTPAGRREHASVGMEIDLVNLILRWLGNLSYVCKTKGLRKPVGQTFGNVLIKSRRLTVGIAGENISDFELSTALPEIQRTASALRTAMYGIHNAIMTSFGCARLMRAHWDWDDWRTDWSWLPGARAAQFLGEGQEPRNNEYLEGQMFTRHGLDLGHQPNPTSEGGRFFTATSSQTFYGLISALGNEEKSANFRDHDGRRFLVLTQRRGVGKGHLFSVLQGGGKPDEDGEFANDVHLRELLHSLHPVNNRKCKWIGAAFFNLSHSIEVNSAFDRLAVFLDRQFRVWLSKRSGKLNLNGEIEEINERYMKNWAGLSNDRIGKLRYVLEEWSNSARNSSNVSGTETHRTLVAFNSIGVLFNGFGEPKNGLVKQIFAVLVSDSARHAPVDFVLVCDLSNVPSVFRVDGRNVKDKDRHNGLNLPRFGMDTEATEDVRRVYEELQNYVPKSVGTGSAEMSANSAVITDPDFSQVKLFKGTRIHVLGAAQATGISFAFFPRVTYLTARAQIRRIISEALPGKKFPAIFVEDDTEKIRKQVGKFFNELGKTSWRYGITSASIMPEMSIACALLVEGSESETMPSKRIGELIAFAKGKTRNVRYLKNFRTAKFRWELVEYLVRQGCFAEGAAATDKKLVKSFSDACDAYDKTMRDLFQAVGRSRYALTIAFATAHELTSELTSKSYPPASLHDIEVVEVDAAMTKLQAFFERLEGAMHNISEARRPSETLSICRTLLTRHDENRARLPIKIEYTKQAKEDRDKSPYKRATPAQLTLLNEIITHLAVMSHPVEISVLTSCRDIRRAAVAVTKHEIETGQVQEPVADDKLISRIVEQMIGLCLHRCLVMKIRPREVTQTSTDAFPAEDLAANSNEDSARYAVHGLVRGQVFYQLGRAERNISEIDQYTISMYATQPDDLPRLTAASYQKLTDMIQDLIAYPNSDAWSREEGGESELSPPHRLRAAFGIMRSSYSIGVLSRFDEIRRDGDLALGKPGHFESYRRLLLWILRQTAEISCKPSADSDARPFYSEDIAWLYNEAGVLSLVQGRISDALSLLQLALSVVYRDLEPKGFGPLHTRILLNKAVVDIERGRGEDALPYLRNIQDIPDEHPVPKLIATGYIGLIEHLQGNFDQARKNYRISTEGLAELKRFRAASIFSRHWGDLERREDRADSPDAAELIERSIQYAIEGGHEDLRQLGLMAQVKLHISQGGGADLSNVHNVLDKAERYAHTMEMPRLAWHVAEARARLSIAQGEMRVATSEAVQALTIASSNELRIRKISTLVLLAEVFQKRGRVDEATSMINVGATLARAAHCHYDMDEIDRIRGLNVN